MFFVPYFRYTTRTESNVTRRQFCWEQSIISWEKRTWYQSKWKVSDLVP